MPIPPDHRPIPHSEMPVIPGAKLRGEVTPDSVFRVRIVLRRRPGAPPLPDARHWMRLPPGRRQFLTAPILAEHFGASPDDAAVVRRHLEDRGLHVEAVELAARAMTVRGTARAMSSAFGVTFHEYEYRVDRPALRPDAHLDPAQAPPRSRIRIFRGYTGAITLPSPVADAVETVLGLSNLDLGGRNTLPPGVTAIDRNTPLTVVDVAGFYNFPASDAGQARMAIFVVANAKNDQGVGANVAAYYDYLNGTLQPPDVRQPPSLTFATPASTTPPVNGPADEETTLDVCVASTVAQGAAINVYQIASSSDHTAMSSAWHQALTDFMLDSQFPPVLSISSFLSPDDSQSAYGNLSALSDCFQALAARGVSVLVASGDDGVRGGPGASANPAVQYPASDPWVTTCGGTALGLWNNPNEHPGIQYAESAWNNSEHAVSGDAVGGGATGGGVSRAFPCPPWQLEAGLAPALTDNAHAVGRGVPDIAGNASPESAYFLRDDGQSLFWGWGTSAVAPLYAGLVTVLTKLRQYPLGFLNPTLYQFPAVCNDVIQGDNHWEPTASPRYAAGPHWDACTGWGSLDGARLLGQIDALAVAPAQTIRIVVEHPVFARPTSFPTSFAAAFFVVVEGLPSSAFSLDPAADDALNAQNHAPDVIAAPAPAGMLIHKTHVDWNRGLSSAQPQTITFTYAVELTAANAFPAAGASTIITLQTHQGALADTAHVELVTTAEPYFADADIPWLSGDLRVFKVVQGDAAMPTRFGAPDPFTTSPLQFIQTAITNLRNGAADFAAFDSLPQDEAQSALAVTPTLGGQAVYNFALARVHYRAPSVDSDKVRVFFRTFPTMSTGTVYTDPTEQSGNYRTSSDGLPNGAKIPLLGIENNHYTAVPYFAGARVATNQSMTTQADPTNVVASIPHGGVPETLTYFGCWLDFNQDTPRFPAAPPTNRADGPFQPGDSPQSILSLIAGAHQCLVAEISFDGTAIPAGTSPGASARLAQRNIAWATAENPGETGESRRVPHTFEIRGARWHGAPCEPDELMIDWGNVPQNSLGRIYLPTLDADELLALAASRQATPPFFRYDAHSVYCVARGVTYLPIPHRRVARHPALLTIDLPSTIRKGQEYRIIVRQLTSAPDGLRHKSAGRRVLGSFQINIPVDKRHVLLPREERSLAALRVMADRGSPDDPWRKVLGRYVHEQEARVRGLGGDPRQIRPVFDPANHRPIGDPGSRKD